MEKIPRLARRAPLELLIAAAIVLLAAVLFLAHSYMSETFDASRRWGSASDDLKARVTESHLWLEERLGGDESIDVARHIFGNIDGALAECRGLVNGGWTRVGEIERLPAGEARSTAAKTCAELLLLRTAAVARLSAGREDVGQPADQAYDAAFNRVIGLARKTQSAAEMHVEDRHMLMDWVNAATIAFVFLLLGGLIVVVRSHQSRVRRLSRRSDLILNSAGEGIYGLDRDGRTIFVNAAAARITGHMPEELIGRRSHEVVHHTRPDGSPYPIEECPAAAAVREGRARRVSEDLYWRKDGTSFPVEYTSTPIVEDGEVTGAVVVFKDITDRKQTEELLERQRRQLVEAQSVGGFGSWEWDMTADAIEWSDELCRIYGLEPGSHPTAYDEAVKPTHPDDRARTEEIVQEALASGEPFAFEYRVLRPDGAVRTAHCRGELISAQDGTPLRMLGTVQDITERREVERAREQFTSVVSHELRTPLTSIRGSLGLLESGALGPLPDKSQRMVQIAVENTDRLVRLINDILDLERIDSHTTHLRHEPCDAAQLIERATEAMLAVAVEAGVTLAVDAQPISLQGDPDGLIQTLTNLLGNAVKFAPAGSTVQVRAQRRDDEALFEVCDRGRGIPADKLEEVFERFQQVDSSDAREKGGTGLGLAICRSIVEQHGGRIWVDSEVGVGSTFAFGLPIASRRRAGAGELDGDGAHRPCVLVCDDDADIREVVGTMLAQHGYRVVEAAGGEEAIQAALADPPDAILLDLLMADMSGWETASALRAHPQTDHVPIVILSVLPRREENLADAAIVDWVEKPADDAALVRAVKHALGSGDDVATVVVVEDDPDLAELMRVSFERHGIDSFIAASGREAIELCQRVVPDLLVLDVGLPDIDGFEVVDWLRRHERLSALPLVVYTARDLGHADRERLMLGSITEFLIKSQIPPEQFERRVIALLAQITHDPASEISHAPAAHPAC